MAAEVLRMYVLTSFRFSRVGTLQLSIRAADSRGTACRSLTVSAPFCRSAFTTRRSTASAGFPHWERMFRNLTGLGKVDFEAPARSTPKRYDFFLRCFWLLARDRRASVPRWAAAERGASVLLGRMRIRPRVAVASTHGGGASENAERTEALIASVRGNSRIRLLTGTYAAGYYADHWVALVSPECLVKVRAAMSSSPRALTSSRLSSVAHDLPGVMLASAAQRLLYHHARSPLRAVSSF